MLDGVEADRAELERLLYRRVQVGELEASLPILPIRSSGRCSIQSDGSVTNRQAGIRIATLYRRPLDLLGVDFQLS